MSRTKIWIFTDEHGEDHEFYDPYEMMKYMSDNYIEQDVLIGWRFLKPKYEDYLRSRNQT